MFRTALTVWPCVIALLGTVACRKSADRINQEIRNITSAESPPAYLEGVRWKLVRQIYEDRHYRPLWVGIRPLPERTKELIANLCDAEREGLRPADYRLSELRRTLERLQPSLDKQRPEAFAVLDLELTTRFLDYGADLLAGRLDPKAVASEWYIRARRSTIEGTLRGAVQAEEFQGIVAPLRPQSSAPHSAITSERGRCASSASKASTWRRSESAHLLPAGLRPRHEGPTPAGPCPNSYPSDGRPLVTPSCATRSGDGPLRAGARPGSSVGDLANRPQRS